MAISTDYSTPVMVNGYTCKNCTDVANAKKNIDPQHPRSGPYGINAQTDPTVKSDPAVKQSASVKFDGALAGLNDAVSDKTQPDAVPRAGAQLDVTV
jgi:hypothetical protein